VSDAPDRSAGGVGTPRSAVPLGTLAQRAVGVIVLLVGLGVVLAPRMSVNRYDVIAAAAGLVVVIAAWVPTSAHPDTVPVRRIRLGATLRASQASGGTRGRHHPWRGRRVGSDLRRWREARLR
jgi:hypothetical protein